MNKLTYRNDFQQVLADYTLSETARDTLTQTQLVLLVGPSSSGRNTIIRELIKSGGYHQIISDTTRRPRVNDGIPEQNGREYWFRSEAEILQDLHDGNFLEAAIIHDQQVSGISMRELQAAANEGKAAINEIEVIGADTIYQAKSDAMFFFVIPPSFDEWMARMGARGELPADEVRRRLESAVNELSVGLNRSYYRFIVNETYTHAAKRIDEIVATGTSINDQEKAKDIAGRLLVDTKAHLV